MALTTLSDTSGISSSTGTHSISMVTQCKALGGGGVTGGGHKTLRLGVAAMLVFQPIKDLEL